MDKKDENMLYCSHCGMLINNDDYETIQGEVVCGDCIERFTQTCECCGVRVWDSDCYGDEYTTLCSSCYQNHYTRCIECNTLLRSDDAYHVDGDDYCSECYRDIIDRSRIIHEYSYKPEPKFRGESKRFFGVELEIDGAGCCSENADDLLTIANSDEENLYCKSDGSLDDGFELVTFPMALNYHKEFCWEQLMKKAIDMGYRSHQTKTCGLHVHVNRDSLGDTQDEQEVVISHILFFVECHWAELLKFSRRSEYSINRWAARYGYEKNGRDILEKAKKGNLGRYAAVNLQNYSTIEFRIFRGTLKRNTLIAALELVNEICDIASTQTEDDIAKMSWSDFVKSITEPELITYLRERQLYVNDEVTTEEEI